MKLYATLETSRGKTVSVSDNHEIIATVYDGNLKAYSVHIEFTNIGDIEKPTMGAIVTTRDWRNQTEDMKYYDIVRFFRKEGKRPRVIKTGLTLKQVQKHCNNPETRKEGVWFDGYSEHGNYR